jgi:hypothetical protein
MAAHPVGHHGEAEFRALRTGHGDGVFLAVAAPCDWAVATS